MPGVLLAELLLIPHHEKGWEMTALVHLFTLSRCWQNTVHSDIWGRFYGPTWNGKPWYNSQHPTERCHEGAPCSNGFLCTPRLNFSNSSFREKGKTHIFSRKVQRQRNYGGSTSKSHHFSVVTRCNKHCDPQQKSTLCGQVYYWGPQNRQEDTTWVVGTVTKCPPCARQCTVCCIMWPLANSSFFKNKLLNELFSNRWFHKN